jgi:nucleotide-binding universal stress UspA family protein
MYRLNRILSATDGGRYGANAVATGAALARRAEAAFEVVTVVVPPIMQESVLPPSHALAGLPDTLAASARHAAEEQAKEAGAPDAAIHVRSGPVAPLVTEFAERAEADLLVVGAHPQPPFRRIMLGSTAERLMRMTLCPILAALGAGQEPFRRILVAIDLSHHSRQVLEVASAMVSAEGSELRVVYVKEPPAYSISELVAVDEEEIWGKAQDRFDAVVDGITFPDRAEIEMQTREGPAGGEIIEEAYHWDADLIVMGTHGYGFIERALLGSTSLHVLRNGRKSTLVVPRGNSV